jgi:hypothetical protein
MKEITYLRKMIEASVVVEFEEKTIQRADENLLNFVTDSGLHVHVDRTVQLEKILKIKNSPDWVHKKTKHGVSVYTNQNEVILMPIYSDV